jgi:hypothetical protein
MFSSGIARLPVLLLTLTLFGLIPPENLARGPDLCLWRHLFHLAACPACGTTRALAAFFHGQFTQALSFNLNVLITAPALLILLAADLLHFLRRYRSL